MIGREPQGQGYRPPIISGRFPLGHRRHDSNTEAMPLCTPVSRFEAIDTPIYTDDAVPPTPKSKNISQLFFTDLPEQPTNMHRSAVSPTIQRIK